jgi:hypothetical protein
MTVMFGLILMTNQPSMMAVIACLLMLIGVFFVYYGQADQVGVLRNVDLSPANDHLSRTRPADQMTIKSNLLVMIAERGALWDYELARLSTKGINRPRRRLSQAKQMRLALVEAAAAGLITPIEDRIDDGSHYRDGRLATRYRLTAFGSNRLQQVRLVKVEQTRKALLNNEAAK